MVNKPILPKKWNKDLAYLFGLLLGDGTLPYTYSKKKDGRLQKRFIIAFCSNSKEFIDNVYNHLFQKVFSLKPYIEIRKKKNLLYVSRIESKETYNFLREWGYIPGRKAKIAKIPANLPEKFRVHILAGLLDTDGGKKGSGFGLSTSSENLANFCISIFKELNIPYHSCPWHYNNHIYHQIYVRKHDAVKILKFIPIKNKDKIGFIEELSKY